MFAVSWGVGCVLVVRVFCRELAIVVRVLASGWLCVGRCACFSCIGFLLCCGGCCVFGFIVGDWVFGWCWVLRVVWFCCGLGRLWWEWLL